MKPYYSEDGITIYHGDCRDVLPGLAADVLVTDPPYGLGAAGRSGGRASRLWRKGETWDDTPVDQSVVDLAIGTTDHAIVWGGNYYTLPPSRCWLIWDKVQAFSWADAELAWTNLVLPVRVFRLSRIDAYVNRAESVKQHPTEKPASLMRWCLGLVPTAQTVLDPFMGSGTTLVAAKQLGRRAIGIEIEERYCEIAAKRLAQGVLALGDDPPGSRDREEGT